MKKVIFWELNEINFEYVNTYIAEGKLPYFKKFIDDHGLFKTSSERAYEELEPWIQWPTLRTGLSYDKHKVFRLGDIEGSGLKQHWEILEDQGYSVAAISPINAVNNTSKSPFWIPDPWVDTKIGGKGFIERIARAVKQAVNDNSQEKLQVGTIIALLEALITRSKASSWPQYVSSLFGALKKQHWSKAILLDRLLADVFVSLWNKHQPDFSVLFLNSGAHIQHHYMCSAMPYDGAVKNPSWYVKCHQDPLLELLEMYDDILRDLMKIKGIRLIISTGLQQVPYEQPAFYWRLKDHDVFLSKMGIKFSRVQPRMTRDFLLEFDDYQDLISAKGLLSKIESKDGEKIFKELDDRGNDLFVSLTYDKDITESFSLYLNSSEYKDFRNDVAFVAIKNGHHHGTGYYLDSFKSSKEPKEDIPLQDLFKVVMSHFSIKVNNENI
jgi:hypothetical protein